jgi:hypothetical protein
VTAEEDVSFGGFCPSRPCNVESGNGYPSEQAVTDRAAIALCTFLLTKRTIRYDFSETWRVLSFKNVTPVIRIILLYPDLARNSPRDMIEPGHGGRLNPFSVYDDVASKGIINTSPGYTGGT